MRRCGPTPDELRAAFEKGARVLAGLPTLVTLDRGATAVLDVGAATRGEEDPYYVIEDPLPGVRVVHTPGDVGVSVAGMDVDDEDHGPTLTAIGWGLKAREDRHDELADGFREAAGRAAMRVTNVMVRARLLDAVDGWSAVLGRVVDDSEEATQGRLHEPSDEDLDCRMLRVVCPSTGRIYVLRVPSLFTTAREARLWTLRSSVTPDIET